jgi:multiple sugar transport system permease protein
MSVVQRKRRRGDPTQNNLLGYFFIAPAMILYLVFNIWPIVRGLLMAFTDYRFVYPETRWEFNGLDNFARLFTDSRIVETLLISLRYTVIVVPVTVAIALLVAVLISRVERGAAFYRWVVYLPTILPIAVSFLTFQELYGSKFGFINSVLRNWGIENPPNWLGDVATALPAIGFAHVWIIFGFPTLLFLIGIYNIGVTLYEAASIDGANAWQQFRLITLPLLKPTLAMVLILTIPGILTVTDPMLILTNGGPQDSTRTLGLYTYQVAFQRGDLRLGYASAISLTISLVTTAMVAVIFWWSREKD